MNQEQVQQAISQSKQGNTEAFRLLVVEYNRLLFALAFRLLCNEEEAKDVVQDTFIKVWLSLDRYNSNFRFSTWIYKIACNACYDRLKSRQHEACSSMNAPGHPAVLQMLSDEDVEAAVINKELKELVLRLTSELTPKQKTVFVLRDIEGLEVDEVALITGLSAAKIKSNLYLARRYIRERLTKMNADETK